MNMWFDFKLLLKLFIASMIRSMIMVPILYMFYFYFYFL